VVVLSIVTDVIFHVLGVYPPWTEPMWETSDNALALSYRIVYGILGSFIAAKVAPRRPMKHAMIVGIVGFVLSTLGAVGSMMIDPPMGPKWYPIALALTALPCAWLGGLLHQKAAQSAA